MAERQAGYHKERVMETDIDAPSAQKETDDAVVSGEESLIRKPARYAEETEGLAPVRARTARSV